MSPKDEVQQIPDQLPEEDIQHQRRTPQEIYESLDLGPGGYAIAPSTETRRGVREALRRKFGR